MGATGLQKAMSLLLLAFVGRYVRNRFSKEAAKGVNTLIMSTMLPAVLFKSLASVTAERSMMFLPVLGVAFVIYQAIAGELIGTVLFGPSKALVVPRRTVALMVPSIAPGLSAFAFINEFVGTEAAGLAAMADLASKVYLVALMPIHLSLSGASGSEARHSAAAASPASRIVQELKDPLNLSILGGLAMSICGRDVASLGVVGDAILTLASAQTPVLFVLIGIKVSFEGSTPAICAASLCLRFGCTLLFAHLAVWLLRLPDDHALAATIMCQAAVSVMAYGQLEKVAVSRGYDKDLAFDLVSFSFPLSVALNTTACIARGAYVARLLPISAGFLAAGAALAVALRDTIRDAGSWATVAMDGKKER